MERTTVTTAELNVPAPRPLNGCLASNRVPALRPWREGLAAWWEAWSGATVRPS